MSEAYISQVMAFGFNFAPKNWAMCNGQIIPITQNTALFSLIGTTYGGNGTTNFALPNRQSRAPLSYGSYIGQNYSLGEMAGEEQVTLTINELPAHSHMFVGASTNGNAVQPVNGAVLSAAVKAGPTTGDPFYAPQASLQPLNPGSLTVTGGNLPHPNLQPYLALNWCICQFGIFPSRN